MPEGILLITQRITKYPVLVERIIKNTEGKESILLPVVLVLYTVSGMFITALGSVNTLTCRVNTESFQIMSKLCVQCRVV